MSGYTNDRGYHEELYIERRHSESPSRYAQAPYTPGLKSARHDSAPHFNPVYYGEEPRGRTSSRSSRSSSRQPSHYDEQMIRYEEHNSRAQSVDESRRRSRSASRSRSSSRHGSSGSVGPDRALDIIRKPSSVSHPVDEDPYFTAADEAARQKKARNKQMLYTGLAAITTIAATNNVYQSSKAHKARKTAVREGFMDEADAKKARNKAIAMDIFSVGVGAICVNNAVNGWKKTKAMKAEEEERRERWESHSRDQRRRSMVAY